MLLLATERTPSPSPDMHSYRMSSQGSICPVTQGGRGQSVGFWEEKETVKEVSRRGRKHLTSPESAAEAKCQAGCIFSL